MHQNSTYCGRPACIGQELGASDIGTCDRRDVPIECSVVPGQVVIANAGHMLPRDQGHAAQQMIEQWIEDALSGSSGVPHEQ